MLDTSVRRIRPQSAASWMHLGCGTSTNRHGYPHKDRVGFFVSGAFEGHVRHPRG